MLREEQDWLAEARQLVAEVRYFRESEDHRWPAVCVAGCLRACSRWRRRIAGAGYGAFIQRDAAADASLREPGGVCGRDSQSASTP